MEEVNKAVWPNAARALFRQSVRCSLDTSVIKLLSKSDIKRILVACSGGADSVFMLCLLWAQAETLGVKLVVAHYNHRWRGEDSDDDARFVATIAEQLECPFLVESCPKSEREPTETSARSLRINFLRAAAMEYSCQCIAFGHQQDDILETQLQRLARGSGAEGLAAPRPVHYFDTHPTHIRPLLNLTSGTIREMLKKNAVIWREDASNQDVGISRNALRHSVIPIFREAVEHDVNQGAARSRKLLEEDANALDQLARELLPLAFSGSKTLERALLKSVPRAVTRRALTVWLSVHQLNNSLGATAMDQLVDSVYADKDSVRLSASASFIVINTSSIWFESAESPILSLEPCSLRAGESILLSTGALLETEFVSIDETLLTRLANGTIDVNNEAYISASPNQSFLVRSRQPKDSFKPLGAPGGKKLKEWFTDRKIPIRERNSLPIVLTCSGVVVWVPGLPPADNLKINPTTKTALKLTYKIRKTTLSN